MAVKRRNPSLPDYSAQAAVDASLASAPGHAVPRTDYSGMPDAAKYSHELEMDPDFQLPDGFEMRPTAQGANNVRKEPSWWDKHMEQVMWATALGLGTAGIGSGIASGAGWAGGAGAGAGAGTAATIGAGGIPSIGATGGIAAGSFPAIAGTSGAAAAGGGAATAGGIGSSIANYFKPKGGGIDYTSLALGGLSALGGDEPLFQPHQSFEGTGADPTQRMSQFYDALENVSAQLAERTPTGLSKNSVVAEGPAPVSIDGIPFQIGGGLGRDPAISDPSLLEGRAPLKDPLAGTGQNSGGQRSTPSRRKP